MLANIGVDETGCRKGYKFVTEAVSLTPTWSCVLVTGIASQCLNGSTKSP